MTYKEKDDRGEDLLCRSGSAASGAVRSGGLEKTYVPINHERPRITVPAPVIMVWNDASRRPMMMMIEMTLRGLLSKSSLCRATRRARTTKQT